jgi:hypothetical protein
MRLDDLHHRGIGHPASGVVRLAYVLALAMALSTVLQLHATPAYAICGMNCPGPTPPEMVEPTASFTAPARAGMGRSQTLTSTATVDPLAHETKEVWSFGEGLPTTILATSATLPSTVTHSWASLGSKTVTLTVWDDQGKSDVVSKTVVVAPPADISAGGYSIFAPWGQHQPLSFASATSDLADHLVVTVDGTDVVVSDSAVALTSQYFCATDANGTSARCAYVNEPCDYICFGGAYAPFQMQSAKFDTGPGNDSIDLHGFTGFQGVSNTPQARVDPGTGTNTITGSLQGSDLLDLGARTGGMSVNLATGVATGSSESDTFTSLEDVTTGAGNDTITAADSNPNVISCGGGTDHVTANLPADAPAGDCEFVNGSAWPITPPTSSVAPSVTGNPDSGELLTCNVGTWSGASTFTYSWRRDGQVTAATATTYLVDEQDAGHTLACVVVASNSAGESDPATSPAVTIRPLSLQAASVSGQNDVGAQLTCAGDTWRGAVTVTRQWLRDDMQIDGATGATYTVGATDAGTTLQCSVTASNAGGSTTIATTGLVVRPFAAALPAISGSVSVGSDLTCVVGSWDGASSFAYQWLHNGTLIAGATASSYRLVSADAGTSMLCRVSASNAGGSTTVDSPRVDVPLPVVAESASGVTSGSSGIGGTSAPLSTSIVFQRLELRLAVRRGLPLVARCSARCHGSVALTISGRLARSLHLTRSRRSRFVLGSAKVSCAGACRRIVHLRLSRRTRSILSRQRRLGMVATFVARDAQGRPAHRSAAHTTAVTRVRRTAPVRSAR